MQASIFITGASGSGKSTLCEGLMDHGFVPSPNHLTRKPRPGEVDGVHGVFIDEDEFRTNFKNGLYLEPDLATARYSGVLYGSPRLWIEQIESSENGPIIATPANVLVIHALRERLTERGRQSQLRWINLHAPIEVRRARIQQRVTDPADLHVRLNQGVSMGIQPHADINIDTSLHDQGLTREVATGLVLSELVLSVTDTPDHNNKETNNAEF